MYAICCICHKQVPNDDYKDIMNESLFINSQANRNINKESNKYISLRDAIELIIGCKVLKIDNTTLCEVCFQKVESYIKFRSEVILSFKSSNSIQVSNINLSDSSGKKEDIKALQITKIFKQESKVSTKEIIDIVEDNNHSSFNKLSNNECDASDSINSKLSNDKRNDDLNDSDSSNDNLNIDILLEHPPKIKEHDIESEIDVCSGEDDEVLELDIQHEQNETVSISSSSESDVEVCDYEPAVKRIKHYTTFSPAILY